MVLVTGPTGSGKTSTLYAGLNALRSETRSIVTVEDPVEYRLDGVSQVAVSPRAGLTFAAGLRSILRQDPDVIMVGEIRDLETAEVAFQAAQTGHLVLSTLHTNDAPSAVTRLVQMGLPAYVVASSLVAAVSQRLVRRLCACRSLNPDGTASPTGCERCRYQGYQGRLGVFELMPMTRGLRQALAASPDDDAIRREAAAAGMRTLWADAMLKVGAGLTTLEEIARVVPPDDEVSLPPPAEPAAAPAPPDTEAPPRVLVVDDDRLTRNLVRLTLEKAHVEVIEATDGSQALAAVYKSRPDLVLTDMAMPGLDGFGLLRKLRADLSTCQIPVVMLTASGDSGDEVKALELGADDYITKPLDRDRLLGRVRRALLRAGTPRSLPAHSKASGRSGSPLRTSSGPGLPEPSATAPGR
jgi:type IV pilus assembly protein PilB